MNRYPIDTNENKLMFLDWYKECFPMIKKLVYEKTDSIDNADDIFQDCLLIVWEKYRRNELNLTSKLSTYIYGIAENKCREFLRRKEKKYNRTLIDDFDTEEEKGYDNEQDILIMKLTKCVDKLPETRKKIVMDYYYMKYDMKAIAEKHNFANSDSIKSQKYKAILDLKNCIKIPATN